MQRHGDPVVSFSGGESLISSPQVSHELKLAVADGLHLLEHGPLDTLSAGRRRQGAVEAPEAAGVQAVDEVLNAQREGTSGGAVSRDAIREPLVNKSVVLVSSFSAIEHNAENAAEAIVLIVQVNKVHLHVHVAAFNRVFAGRVHVELHHFEERGAAGVKGAGHVPVHFGSGKVDLKGVAFVVEGHAGVVAVVGGVDLDVVAPGGLARQVNGGLLAAQLAQIRPVGTVLGVVDGGGGGAKSEKRG